MPDEGDDKSRTCGAVDPGRSDRVSSAVSAVSAPHPSIPELCSRLSGTQDALRRLMAAGIPLEGASDHGVSEALYLRDPDGNGVELYWDRPTEQWPRTPVGELNMGTEPLDLHSLLKETR